MSAILVSALLCASCTFSFKTDEGDYKTPDLFFKQAENWGCGARYYSSKRADGDVLRDCDSTLLNEMKAIKQYQAINQIEQKSDTYFVYEYLMSATSGPNIARMTVFENGYIEIYRKQSLGSPHSFFFSVDSSLAASLNRFVENLEATASSSESI